MKKLLLVVLLFPVLAFAQGAQRIGQATQNVGGFVKVLSGASVNVCSYPSCSAVTIYSDVGLSVPIIQPLKADVNGNYMYFAPAANYYEKVSSPGATTQTNFVSLDQGTIANFAAPPPIGNATPNTGAFTTLTSTGGALNGTVGATAPNVATFSNVNGAINAASCSFSTPPSWCSGSDIGAWINAGFGQSKTVWVPGNTSYTQTASISVPAGGVLQCGTVNNSLSAAVFNYTGSSDAIDIPGGSGTYKGQVVQNCGWILGSSTAYGMNNQSGSTYVENVFMEGGGSSTTFLHINGNIQQYKNVQMWNVAANAIECDNALDTFLTDFDVYGTSAHTGVILTLDSGCSSFHVNHFSGGASNLHGLVLQNTLGGNPPSQLFFTSFVTDDSYDDGWVFASSLGSFLTQAVFTDSWSAGAGVNGSGSTLQAHKAGVHISGGTGYNFNGGKYRDNSGSGFLIDNTNAQAIGINGAQILSNNINNDGTESGIDVTAAVTGLAIVGNTITNSIDFRGHQNYGINITGSSPSVNIRGNMVYGNSVGNYSLASGIVYVEDPPFRMQIPSGATGIYTYPQSDADNSQYSILGFNHAQSSTNWFITKGGNANFIAGITTGSVGGNSGQINLLGSTSGTASIAAQAVAGTPSLALPTTSGTLAASATSPIAINGTTGVVSCSTCVTSVTATAPIQSTGTTTPVISCPTCGVPLTGTTGSIGGSALTIGTCSSGTASVAGAVVGHPVAVSASDGTLPNGSIILSAAVTSSNAVTVQICATGSVTPTAKTYNVTTQ